MVEHTTRWSPDTCQCIVEFSWDDSVSVDERVHSISNIVQRCSAHSNTLDNITHWNILTEENPRKNIARQLIIDNAPLSFVDVAPDSGTKTLKVGLNIDFTVDGVAPNRVFTLIFTGATLTDPQKANVQTRLDNRFGVGKVIFVN